MKKNIIITTITLITLLLIIYLTTATTITGQGSSYTFTIENCTSPQINDTINCTTTNIRFECDIYNPAFINQVEYRIQGTDYTTTQNSTNPKQFYYYYNKPAEGNTNLDPIILDRERITDTNNNKVNAYEYVAIQHNCTTCPANTTRTELEPCQTNDTQRIQYTSSNETCIPSYNTTETCNYCNQDIYQNTSDCDINNTQTINYFDLNITTCCYTTGLPTDCLIQTYPYNTTTTQNCDYYKKEINCTLDQTPILNQKINVNCILPDNLEYCCVINTYQNQNLLATTPEYKQTSQSLLTITQEQETRTCFTTTQKMLNAYYTTKELRPDTNYTIEILCTNNQTSNALRYQQQITPVYHTYDWLPHRMIWLGDNPIFTILTIPLIIAFILGIIFLIRKIRGK